MQTPPYFPALPVRLRRTPVIQDRFQPQDPSYFDTHPVSEIARSVIFTGMKWGLVIYVVHFVYTMFAGH